MNGPAVIAVCLAIALLLVAALLLSGLDEPRHHRDVRHLNRQEAARRRLSTPRSMR